MDRSSVSIIIPAFNAERYLGAALESVLAQTYPHWEALVVVDGGCRDGTERVAREYAAKDVRIKVIMGPHERMGAARNRGIAAAQGGYIAFLDADNLLAPGKLKDQVAHLEGSPGAGVSFGNILHFYDDRPDVRYTNRNETPPSGDLFISFLSRNSINLLAVVIKKELLTEHGAFRGEWPALDDQYLWINLARHGVGFAYLNEVVGYERMHHASDSRRSDHIYDTARCFLSLLDNLEAGFSVGERGKYSDTVRVLRRTWRRNLVIGWLMKTPPFSWAVLPWYLRRREGHFVKLEN